MIDLPPVAARTPARVVRVSGKDAVSYLEDVTSQAISDLAEGQSRPAMVLEASGEPVVVFDVIARDDHLLLVAPDESSQQYALGTMAGRTFLLEVAFEATDLCVVALRGLAEPVAAPVVARIERVHGVDLVTDDPGSLLDSVPAARVDDDAEAARVLSDWDLAHGVPRWGHEITPPHLPEEIGVLPTHVHLKKGCYPGQEAVARMWNLGRPRRRLATIRVTGQVTAGTEEGSGQERILVTGVVGTGPAASRSGGQADLAPGLAFVGRDAAIGDVYELSDAKVEITGFVGEGLEQPGHDANVTRRRDTR